MEEYGVPVLPIGSLTSSESSNEEQEMDTTVEEKNTVIKLSSTADSDPLSSSSSSSSSSDSSDGQRTQELATRLEQHRKEQNITRPKNTANLEEPHGAPTGPAGHQVIEPISGPRGAHFTPLDPSGVARNLSKVAGHSD
jgi:hypothetical protein